MLFDKFKEWTIPEGKVSKLEINGKLYWSAVNYTPVKYLSTNGYQFIITDLLPSMNHVIEMDIRMDDDNDSGVIYGVRQSVGGVQTSLFKYNSDNTFIVQSTNGYKIFGKFKRHQWVNIKIDYSKKEVFVNGEKTPLDKFVFGKITKPYYLFTFDKLGSTEFPSTVSLKSFKVSQNNTVLVNYKAVLDENNKPTLYDSVNNKFYHNSGRGEFGYETIDGTIVPPTGNIDDELKGSWSFNNTLTKPTIKEYVIDFYGSNFAALKFTKLALHGDFLSGHDTNGLDNIIYDYADNTFDNRFKDITITDVSNCKDKQSLLDWLKANATKTAQLAQTLEIDSSDGDLGHTNVIGPDTLDDPYEGLTPEEIAEIEAMRQANGL